MVSLDVDLRSESSVRAYGELVRETFRSAPERLLGYLAVFRDLFEPVFDERREQIEAQLTSQWRTRLTALAQGLGLQRGDVFALHLLGDVCRPTGCSSVVRWTTEGTPVLAHNLDWPDWGIAHELSAMQQVHTTQGTVLVPGFLGNLTASMAVNERMVGAVLHDSYAQTPYVSRDCAPLALSTLDVASRVEHAEEMAGELAGLRTAHGFLAVVVDRRRALFVEHTGREGLVFELAPGETGTWTNHFQRLPIDNSYKESSDRLVALRAAADGAEATCPSLFQVLAAPGVFRPLDHEGATTLRASTLQCMVFDPASEELQWSAIERNLQDAPSPLRQFRIGADYD